MMIYQHCKRNKFVRLMGAILISFMSIGAVLAQGVPDAREKLVPVMYYLLLSDEDSSISSFTFTEQNAPASVLKKGVFSWEIDSSFGNDFECRLDVDGDNITDYLINPCSSPGQLTHSYYQGSATPYMATLTVSSNTETVDATHSVSVPEDTILPNENRTNWESAGIAGGIPSSITISANCNVNISAVSGENITTKIISAIASAEVLRSSQNTDFCVVSLPAGDFAITNQIQIPSHIILKGAGTNTNGNYTKLNATLTSGAAITAIGSGPNLSYAGTNFGAMKSKKWIAVTPGMSAAISDLLTVHGYLYADIAVHAERSGNSSDRIQDPAGKPWGPGIKSYADKAVGQVLKIIGIDGHNLIVDRPVNEDFSIGSGLTNYLDIYIPTSFVENAGLENFIIERIDTSNSDIIQLTRSANVWIKNIHSIKAYRAHVQISHSLNCEVRNGSFSGAHDFGDGGHGYGVKTIFHTNNCLVINNTFDDLRHAISLQLGANANVFDSNISSNSHDNNGFMKADFSLHGHYSYMNLFENNKGVSLQISDWYGPVRYNTFFKNHLSNGILVQYDSYHNALIDNRSDDGYRVFIQIWPDFQVDSSIGSGQIICVENRDEFGNPLVDPSNSHCTNSVSNYPSRPVSYYK